MILIICVDDDFGMLFNKRRQSQDRVLRERILSLTEESVLWMNSYSARQFKDSEARHIKIDDDFMNLAGEGEYCFAEDVDVSMHESRIEKLVIYKWNRKYPSDMKFLLKVDEWKLDQSVDFSGYSHEKITEEVYVK